MPRCIFNGCHRSTRNKVTKELYCTTHLRRIDRNGYPELKHDAWQSKEKLPHEFVDDFILKNWKKMIDEELVVALLTQGIKEVNVHRVKYRRRKLGIRKYLYGEIKKHRVWIRTQAIKRYGTKCELCGYGATIDTHHILPRHRGGPHEIENLMVICPNCHALITRRKIILEKRTDIPFVSKQIMKLLKKFYPL